MAALELSDEEREALVKLLEENVSDLRYEIGNTDSYDYRKGLKHKEAVLGAVLARLKDA